MEIDTDKLSSECPTIEELSTWFDKEFKSKSVEEHVVDCPACQECLKDFETINDSITKVIKINESQIYKISQNCLREISRSEPPSSVQSFPGWMKIAAGLVVAGLVFFMSQSRDVVNSSDEMLSASNERSSFPGKPVIPPATKRYQEKTIKPTQAVSRSDTNLRTNQRTNPPRSSMPARLVNVGRDLHGKHLSTMDQNSGINGDIPFDNVALIGYGNNNSYMPIDEGIANNSLEVLEKSGCVHHVWAMDNPESFLMLLKSLVTRQQNVFDELITQNLDRYHLKFRITKNNFNNLVNNLEKIDCDLLHPDSLEPVADPNNIEISDKTFLYEVDLLRR